MTTDDLSVLPAELRKAAKTFFPDEGTIKICPDCKLEKCEVVNVEGLLWSCECGYEAFISESDLENKWLPAVLVAKEMQRIKQKLKIKLCNRSWKSWIDDSRSKKKIIAVVIVCETVAAIWKSDKSDKIGKCAPCKEIEEAFR